ncbi:MAG: hypothetical protein KC731_16965, partial [Myxococcales bacterium]|nr:hypothetical protein [Myxococcales bacterium]
QPEPLARLTPADCYYLRAHDVAGLFALLDEVDEWGTPLLRLLDETTEQHLLTQRYRTLLGLPGSELAKRLGPTVIERLALVGSDPFLRQGSDVTVIAEVKNATLFAAGLRRELEAALAGREPERETIDHRGVPITIVRSRDGAVQQHRASVGSTEIISTSRGAIQRVLDTIAGRHPSLADEPDFQFMLRRDPAVLDTVLVYAGDRFIESALSPRSRILDARRQIALDELERCGKTALLFGVIHGRAPADHEELLGSKLLKPTDLKHFDRAPITFEPNHAPRSSWGTPAHLTALIDLPDPTRVTKVEQAAYEDFVRRYEWQWSESLDPIALRVATEDGPSGRNLRAKLRVLPLLRTGDYARLVQIAGTTPVPTKPARDGAQIMIAISEDSSVRQELLGMSQSFVGQGLRIDWLGDRAAIGILDRPQLANVVAATGLAPQMPAPNQRDQDEMDALMELPLYAKVAVKNRAAAALAVTFL